MSSPHSTPITCQQCGREQDFTIWQSLNVTLDAEKKGQLLRGELSRFTCSHCQWSGDVVYPMLYHDMTQQLMIWLNDAPGEPDLGHLPFGALVQGYRLRIVTTRNNLVEKIRLFDVGLDDRAVELIKVSIRRQMEGGTDGTLYFASAGHNSDDREVVNFEWLTDQGGQPVAVGRESYAEFAASVAPLLDHASTQPGRWLRIDRDYAEALVKKYLPGDNG